MKKMAISETHNRDLTAFSPSSAGATYERSYGQLFSGRPHADRPQGKIVVDWRTCTDDEFLENLRPVSHLLERARKFTWSDKDNAVKLAVRHFLSRTNPRWVFDYRFHRAEYLPSRNFFFGETVDLAKARRSLRYEFYDHNLTGHYHRLTPSVDWDKTRVRELGSAGWLTMSFGYWALFPAAGFAISRDSRYARVFQKCWQRWFTEFPTVATDNGLNGWGDFNTLDPSGIDIWMNVGRRALVFVDVLYSGLLSAVPTALTFEVIKYLWFVCELFKKLHRLKPGTRAFRRGNHNLFDLGT
ncbi:MAG: hypothetical protein N2255_07650, partial [Kiritimatiellae bacterium]|nr:hypothetical protein [Kiritimatiellia bacterium]